MGKVSKAAPRVDSAGISSVKLGVDYDPPDEAPETLSLAIVDATATEESEASTSEEVDDQLGSPGETLVFNF